jgi:hypothetical protein
LRAVALSVTFTILLIAGGQVDAVTLREAYEQAGSQGEYDKVVVLETGVTYTGGLLIGPVLSPLTWEMEGEPGKNVRIIGNGAILDLQGEQLCISYCFNRLDIDDCIILHGNIRFRGVNNTFYQGVPTGSVRHVTFYQPHDYGVRMQVAGDGITIERNLIVDAVDTGWDFIYTTGFSSEWLPTGTSIAGCVHSPMPTVIRNWTYHSDPIRNAQALAHFSFLCEYG